MDQTPFRRTVTLADPNTPVLDGASTLVEFWRWAFSDIVSNEIRGAFAEFIVGHALDVLDTAHGGWEAWDLNYGEAKIEVKATGDVQAWAPTGKPPRPTWGIGQKRGWSAATNTYAPEPVRSADLYVLCHWQGTDAAPLGPTSLREWNFYVVRTAVLNEHHFDGKQLSLSQLRRLMNRSEARAATYPTLKTTVDEALALP